MTANKNRRVAIAGTGTIVLLGILTLGTCVTPDGESLPEPRKEGHTAEGRAGVTLATPEAGGDRTAGEIARELGESPASTGMRGSDEAARSSGGALVLRDAATGEVLPYFTLRFRDRDREVVLAATDEGGRLDSFRNWIGRGAISLLDEPDLARERWREAPDPVWCADHYELSIDVGPTWSLALTGYGPGEEGALEAWLQVPEGLAFPRDPSRITPVRWEGGTPWVRLPAFRQGMRSFVARQPKSLVVRSPREERIGWAAVDGVLGRQERPLEIDLQTSFVLRGRVRDPEGRAVREASLLLWAGDERPRWGPELGAASAGDDGRFEVFGLRERRYSASFFAPGHEALKRVVDVTEPGGFEVILVPEVPGEHTLVVEVRGSGETSTLVASLFPVRNLGEPRDVELELERGRHVGAFRELHTGQYRLYVEPGRGEAILEASFDGAVEVTVPRVAPVVVNAEAREMVELQVTVDGGEPDRGLVFYGSEDGREFEAVAAVARHGRVRLSAASLTYPMWVLMDGYQPVELLDLAAAADSGRLDVKPRPGWGVFLRVVDAEGPVEGILATLHGDGLGLSDELGTIAVGLALEERTLPVELVRGEAVVGSLDLVRRPASAAVVEVRIAN